MRQEITAGAQQAVNLLQIKKNAAEIRTLEQGGGTMGVGLIATISEIN